MEIPPYGRDFRGMGVSMEQPGTRAVWSGAGTCWLGTMPQEAMSSISVAASFSPSTDGV
jgi:hypothetical protein